MAEEELRKKMANLRLPVSNQPNAKYRYLNYELTDRIFALIKQAGYVQLPENMSGSQLIEWYHKLNYGKHDKRIAK